ncbi:succinyl-diaminopimelate desuccinylase [Magnetovibrio sp. PR-2]|uniref:succinyl-diaminopimelate desuccinylase n=1 Tax=Magnetovibrio sp. PR-2 TaxID=3120356 RepID=UPI002FCE231C
MAQIDPIELTQALIQRPSVTPENAGALEVLEGALKPLGFVCHRLAYSDTDTPDVDNLYARLGTDGPNLCFAGHTDVVPVGDEAAWTYPPFGAEIHDGVLYGRGAVDMKTAIACFVSATAEFLDEKVDGFAGSISYLITGDEEGPAINGTVKVLDWMVQNGETIDACIVGEPSNTTVVGETIKIGRRGSLNGWIVQNGSQGHVAYPQHADNPAPKLVKLLNALIDAPLDTGTEHFQPSNLEVTSIDIGNEAVNIIPNTAKAQFNVRFNDTYTPDSLKAEIQRRLDGAGDNFDIEMRASGESFLTPPGKLSDVMSAAATKITGLTPELSTSGGTSDARFIKDHCAVAEFGLLNQTAHKVDEHIATADILKLTDIYYEMIKGFFAGQS